MIGLESGRKLADHISDSAFKDMEQLALNPWVAHCMEVGGHRLECRHPSLPFLVGLGWLHVCRVHKLIRHFDENIINKICSITTVSSLNKKAKHLSEMLPSTSTSIHSIRQFLYVLCTVRVSYCTLRTLYCKTPLQRREEGTNFSR